MKIIRSEIFPEGLLQVRIPIPVDLWVKAFTCLATFPYALLQKMAQEGYRAVAEGTQIHMAGFPARMDEIMAIARKHNLKVVEDACHGPLSEYKGKKLGTLGDCAAFSFFRPICESARSAETTLVKCRKSGSADSGADVEVSNPVNI